MELSNELRKEKKARSYLKLPTKLLIEKWKLTLHERRERNRLECKIIVGGEEKLI